MDSSQSDSHSAANESAASTLHPSHLPTLTSTLPSSPLPHPKSHDQSSAPSPHPRSSPNRSSLTRNEVNYEKMVRKNIRNATGKPSLKRGLAVVEYFRTKQLQENETEKRTKIAKSNPLPLFASPTRSPHRKMMQSHRSPRQLQSENSVLRGDKAPKCGSLTARLLSPMRSKALVTRDTRYDPNVARMVNPLPLKLDTHSETKSKSPFQSFQKLTPAISRPLPAKFPPKPVKSPPKHYRSPPKRAVSLEMAPMVESVASKSMCFALESTATCVDVTPDGQILIVAFEDGSIRLFDMDSSISSDRFGYLMGHFEACESEMETSSANFYGTMQLRIKISSDGKFLFVGSRVGPKLVLTINLQDFRNEEEEQARFSHSNQKLRGFADVSIGLEAHSYLFLTGLGVQKLHLWQFVPPTSTARESWEYLTCFGANGNRLISASFFSSQDSDTFTFASHCEEKNVQIWCNYVRGKDSDPLESRGKMTLKNCGKYLIYSMRHDIPDTRDVMTLSGSFAYSVHPNNEQICQFQLQLPTSISRQYFNIEKFSAGKSRRSSVILSQISASKDGKNLITISSDGILYASECNLTLSIAGKLDAKCTRALAYAPINCMGMLAILTSNCLRIDPIRAIIKRYGDPNNYNPQVTCAVCHIPNAQHWSISETPANVPRKPRPKLSVETHPVDQELEMYKQRYDQIVTEWQRRLKGERQMRRLFKVRETEFRQELREAMARIDQLEAEIDTKKRQEIDNSTKFQMREIDLQQQANVTSRYRMLCTRLETQLTELDDQKRALEKTSRTLLSQIDHYVSLSKERYRSIMAAECVICREKEAVHAVIPCGHLCLCEEDGNRVNAILTESNEKCPMCQRDVNALLRVN
uniref:Uncharacterized protein AlNc14C40G3405 n=1 Tax=Albugo laibachii Nc14 TaxID=890382 RepID=F0W9E6_9STRA|nr:conserved hypothetical protein [Albugo laibachii Nc14]|eukprot:CCA17760.1 conserved hypothetical protein [Albugo laibachii Nc14]